MDGRNLDDSDTITHARSPRLAAWQAAGCGAILVMAGALGATPQPGWAQDLDDGRRIARASRADQRPGGGPVTSFDLRIDGNALLSYELRQLAAAFGSVSIMTTPRGRIVSITRRGSPSQKPDAELATIMTALGEALRNHGNHRVIVESHSDSVGAAPDNRRKTTLEALRITRLLTAAGLASRRVRPVGYGEDYPIASNQSEQGRSTNRRIEVVVLAPGVEFEAALRERTEVILGDYAFGTPGETAIRVADHARSEVGEDYFVEANPRARELASWHSAASTR